MLGFLKENFNRIIYKLGRIVLLLLFHLTEKFKLYRHLAFALTIGVKISTFKWKYENSVKLAKKSGLTILAFNREIFEKDLLELQKNTELNILIFPLLLYTVLADSLIPAHLRCQVLFHIKNPNKNFKAEWIRVRLTKEIREMFNRKKDEKLIERFNLLVQGIISYFIRWLDIDAMLSSNVQYYQDQAWITACKKKGFPFLVLCKEGPGQTQHGLLRQTNIYNEIEHKFFGFRVATFCEGAKKVLISTGVVNEKDVFVTGSPRSDLIWASNLERKRLIGNGGKGLKKWAVLFDFAEYEKHKLWEDTIKSFIQCARMDRFKDIEFVIKTKGPFFTKELNKFLRNEYNNTGVFEKLIVGHNISFSDLIKNEVLVCGFRTTSIIESMVTDVPILIVNWGEAKEFPPDNMFTDSCSAAYEMTQNQSEFYGKIVDVLGNEREIDAGSYKKTISDREAIIREHLHIIDGKRSLAVANFIKESILDFRREYEHSY